METPWHLKVLNKLEDIPHWYPVVKDLIKDVWVDCMLKGLPSLHLTLWLHKDMCYTNKDSLPQSVGQWQGKLSICNKDLPGLLGRKGRMVCLRGCTKQFHFCPKLAMFWLIYLGLDWLSVPLVVTILLYQPFDALSSQGFQSSIIFKLMHYFYLQHLPSHKCFDPRCCMLIICQLGSSLLCH